MLSSIFTCLWFDVTLQSDVRKVPVETSVPAQLYVMTPDSLCCLGAIFHCLQLGVIAYPKEESAKYLNSWLRVLNDDKKLVFTASSLAHKAMDYTVSLQEEAEQVA